MVSKGKYLSVLGKMHTNFTRNSCVNLFCISFLSMASLVGLSAALCFTHPLGPGIRLIILSTEKLTVGCLSSSSLVAIDRLRTLAGVDADARPRGLSHGQYASSARDTPSELGLIALVKNTNNFISSPKLL
jgi:hypothetical protein